MAPTGERILIIENDPDISDLIARQALQPLGYQTMVLGDAAAAIQQALKTPPDLIIINLNLAGLSGKDLLVAFSSQGRKDAATFVEETGEFVCNLATWDLREAMNMTSAPLPRGTNEMEKAGLAPAPSRMVKPPRVAASPCALECKLLQIVPLRDLDGEALDSHVVFGQVVGVHIDDRFIKDGLLDTAAMKPIARCGYHNYAVVESQFSMIRPTA